MPFPLQSMILFKFHLYCLWLKFNLGIRDSFSLINSHITLRKAHFRKAECLKPRNYLYQFLFKTCAACAELRPKNVLISPKMLHKANIYTHPQMSSLFLSSGLQDNYDTVLLSQYQHLDMFFGWTFNSWVSSWDSVVKNTCNKASQTLYIYISSFLDRSR